MRVTGLLLAAIVGFAGATKLVNTAQAPVILKQQLRSSDVPSPMTSSEVAELGDPFFVLVLNQSTEARDLTTVEDRLQPDRSQRQVFVVSEDIARDAHGQRRMVVSFAGTSGVGPLDGNVMLSVFFDPNGVDGQPIEAWGWDDKRGRYNYYKFDFPPDRREMVWTFRGSSQLADRKTVSERRGSCLMCHVNGAPIMKELLLPWVNWDSFMFRAQYLRPSAGDAWPIARTPRMGQLSGAQNLESLIMSSTDRFNRRRIESTPAAQDHPDIDVRLSLRPVFVTTEINIISADTESGMHPFRSPKTGRPAGAVSIPASFFLNRELLAELGISEANRFIGLARLSPEEYARLVNETKTLFDDQVGDALFAWMTPEPSHVDNNYVGRLVKSGHVSQEFVAAAQLIDLERPVLSPERESLLAHIPTRVALGGDGRPLKSAVLDSIRAQNPPPGTPVAVFAEALSSGKAVELLRARVVDYLDRETKALQDPNKRQQHLSDLYRKLLTRRRDVLNHPVLSSLDETGGLLFPLPR